MNRLASNPEHIEHGFFSSKLAQKKREIFKRCKATFTEACEKGTSASSIKIDADKEGILSKHRFFNRDKQTESARQLEKIQYWLAGSSAATSNYNAPVLMTAA